MFIMIKKSKNISYELEFVEKMSMMLVFALIK